MIINNFQYHHRNLNSKNRLEKEKKNRTYSYIIRDRVIIFQLHDT